MRMGTVDYLINRILKIGTTLTNCFAGNGCK